APKSTSDERRALDQHHADPHTGKVSACVTFGVGRKLPAASSSEEGARRWAVPGSRCQRLDRTRKAEREMFRCGNRRLQRIARGHGPDKLEVPRIGIARPGDV